MAWKDLTARERITAASFDIMRDPEFSLMGGATQIGAVEMVDPEECPTAGTNGRDVVYCTPFVMGLTRPQVRMLVAHETIHKMLHHCIEYTSVCEKYPNESNMAMDYVDNLIIEELDAGRGFIEWIDEPPPLIDQKYKGQSFLEVLQDIIKNPPPTNPQPKSGSGKGSGKPMPLDTHTQGKKQSQGGEKVLSEEEAQTLKQQMQDAVAQGQIVREKLQAKARGDKGSGGRFDAMNQQRTTDWKGPLRRFIQELSEGTDQSRFSPPNKRMLPLGIVLPSHFSEKVGEIVIACDTSGSMGGVYPVVFGEIARICQQVKPTKVRMLWWDTVVAGDQTFTERDYDRIAKQLKPAGGGGTTVSVVADYIKQHKIKARCVIYLSDGYIESNYNVPPIPCLWGVVDNTSFVPRKGKKVDINSVTL
jgi:predicted metal-dependent peptidase